MFLPNFHRNRFCETPQLNPRIHDGTIVSNSQRRIALIAQTKTPSLLSVETSKISTLSIHVPKVPEES